VLKEKVAKEKEYPARQNTASNVTISSNIHSVHSARQKGYAHRRCFSTNV